MCLFTAFCIAPPIVWGLLGSYVNCTTVQPSAFAAAFIPGVSVCAAAKFPTSQPTVRPLGGLLLNGTRTVMCAGTFRYGVIAFCAAAASAGGDFPFDDKADAAAVIATAP